jgi:hypothetical protein
VECSQPLGVLCGLGAVTATGMEARQSLQNIPIVGMAEKRLLQPDNRRFDFPRCVQRDRVDVGKATVACVERLFQSP